jgi:hypothetical protein
MPGKEDIRHSPAGRHERSIVILAMMLSLSTILTGALRRNLSRLEGTRPRDGPVPPKIDVDCTNPSKAVRKLGYHMMIVRNMDRVVAVLCSHTDGRWRIQAEVPSLGHSCCHNLLYLVMSSKEPLSHNRDAAFS